MSIGKKLISWISFRIYRLNLHFDLVLVSRWKWRKYFARDSRILEIGPGGGPWTLELLEKGNTVTVVDVDMSSLLRLKRKIEVFPLKNRRVKLINSHAKNFSSREEYDQIIVFEVLEHIMEDERTVANLVHHLAPGGEILISTPTHDHIPIAGESVSLLEDGRHVRKGYSFENFAVMLSRCGLTIIRKETACGWFTRHAEALSNTVYRLIPIRILFYLVRLAVRPLTHLDFIRPGFHPYSLFLVASVRDSSGGRDS